MKNIMVIDSAMNCVYDIFSIAEESFAILFPESQDIAFVEELQERIGAEKVGFLLGPMWKNRVKKKDVQGIHGTLFYDLSTKRRFYPTLRDEEACNPDGSKLRA